MFRRKKYIFSTEKKRKAKAIKISIATVAVVILGALAFQIPGVITHFAKDVTIEKDPTVELNNKAYGKDFVNKTKKGCTITNSSLVDTSKIGKTTATVEYTINGKKNSLSFPVTVKDSTPPTIDDSPLTIPMGKYKDISSFLKVTDNSGKVDVKVSGDYNTEKDGEYKVKLIATDPSGNKTEKEQTIKVVDIKHPKDNMTFETKTGENAIFKNGILYVGDIPIVNKTFGLPSGYRGSMDLDMDDAFGKMRAAAKENGIKLFINNATVSSRTQQEYYANAVEEFGKEKADTKEMRPGHSESQMGVAVDVNSYNQEFAKTKEFKWLSENAYKYGFVLRYPKGKSSETGIEFQPYHFRYVGKKLAEKLYNKGDWLTLEGYYGLPSSYVD